MTPDQPSFIPDVRILAQSKDEAERLIMFETPALDPDSTYQAVLDQSVSDVPFGEVLTLWVIANTHGEWDGTLKLRVVGIQAAE